MESSIWKGSSSTDARDKYIELASKYKQKHGSLRGFLKENGALLINGNLHKVRLSGERFKLANLWSYNKYQTLRRSREGYNNIRKDLEKLGVDKSEINAFIAKDKKLYKSKVKGFASDDTLGHVLSLEKGGRDGSWNIEGEPATTNFGKQGQSPSSNALLAEGVPRNTGEAYIRSKDPSGLPDPSEFTAAERAELRKLTTADEVNDFLTKKYSQGNNKKSNPLAQIANTVRQQPSAGQVKPSNSGLAALANTVRGQKATVRTTTNELSGQNLPESDAQTEVYINDPYEYTPKGAQDLPWPATTTYLELKGV